MQAWDAAQRVGIVREQAVRSGRGRGSDGKRTGRAKDRGRSRGCSGAGIALRERFRQETVARRRDEVVPYEAQQAGRVVRDDAADRGEQFVGAVLRRERRRQIPAIFEQRRDRRGAPSTVLFV